MFRKKADEENPYWISFTDLMSGFMVIFILVSLFLFTIVPPDPVIADPIKGKYAELVTVFRDKFRGIDQIQVDTSTIRFNIAENNKETALFQRGDREPTAYCEEILDTFIPVFYNELLKIYEGDKDIFEIREIRIEGHTDSRGGYLYNLKLSSQRALKVQEYIVRGLTKREYSRGFQDFVRENSIACGYSFSHPLDKNGKPTSQSNLPEDLDKSRRVEFRILLEYKKTSEHESQESKTVH